MGEFELQWNDFQDSLSSSFKELRDDGDLFDITLACDDGQLEAHKTILSASSTFFKKKPPCTSLALSERSKNGGFEIHVGFHVCGEN